ncbi:MAG: hypothetical protein NT123_17565 [Proteobacteria bacterium]|nr:hypothetical protein [Pseudomonadota bacterium]
MIALNALLEVQLIQNIPQIRKCQIVIGGTPQQTSKNFLKFAHGRDSLSTPAIPMLKSVA